MLSGVSTDPSPLSQGPATSNARPFDRVCWALVLAQFGLLALGVTLRAQWPVRLLIAAAILVLGLVALRRMAKAAMRNGPSQTGSAVFFVPMLATMMGLQLVMPNFGLFSMLGWIILPVFISLGMALMHRGSRFRRHAGLFCANCKYPVAESDLPTRCPECGKPLGRLLSTIKEYHERRPWLIAAGVLVCIVAVVPMFTTIISPGGLSIYRALPDSTAARMAASEPDNLSLWQNIDSRQFDPSVRASLIDAVLSNRPDRASSNAHSERWLTTQVEAGNLTPEQLSRFVRTYAALRLQVRPAEASRSTSSDAPPTLTVELAGESVGCWTPLVTLHAHVVNAALDDHPVELRPSAIGLFDLSPGIRRIKSRRNEAEPLPSIQLLPAPEPRTLRVTVIIVAAGFTDAQQPPRLRSDGSLSPTPSHIAAETIELQAIIPPGRPAAHPAEQPRGE